MVNNDLLELESLIEIMYQIAGFNHYRFHHHHLHLHYYHYHSRQLII